MALDYKCQAADYNHVGYNEPDTVLIAQLMGIRRATPAAGSAATPSEMYAIPHRRMTSQVVSLPLVWETPLRTGNLRDPNGPQSTFAAESFIDEMAVAAKADPLRIPHEDADGLAPTTTADSSARVRSPPSKLRRKLMAGTRVLHRSRAAAATSSPDVGSPTRSAARPSRPRSPRWR